MPDNSLVRRQLESSLEATSLGDLARELEVVMLLLDTSGSMAGKPVIALRETVRGIKAEGHVPMIAFGGPYDAQVRFVDEVPDPDGGTPLHLAIPFAKQYGATRLVVVSDGMPDLLDQSLEEAKAFGGKIDIVFVGDTNDGGLTFLQELARVTGGTQFSGSLKDPKQLTGMIVGLLEGPKEPERAPLQGAGFAVVTPEPDDVDDADDDDDTDDADEGDDDAGDE